MRHVQLARESLDRRLSGVDKVALAVPSGGWVRTIREALGMSTRQLGARAGMSGQAVAKIERSEETGTVQLATLRRLADELDCELVYALVPRSGLRDTVRRRALELAAAHLGAVDRSMRLEDQGVDKSEFDALVADYADRLASSRALWR